MQPDVLRQQLVTLLQGGEAHMGFQDAIKNFPEDKINDKAPNVEYTFYALLEHIRRTQSDILEYIVDPNYKDKEWPKDYWPEKTFTATKADWDKTIEGFNKDVDELVQIAKENDLFAKVPNNETVLRELLLVVDHNAYHIGEFAILRQVDNNWEKGHA